MEYMINHMVFCEHSLARRLLSGAFLLLLLSPSVAQLLPTSSFYHFLSSKYTSICAEPKIHNDRKPKKMPTHLSFPYFLTTSPSTHQSLLSNATILGMSHLLGRKSITGHLKLWEGITILELKTISVVAPPGGWLIVRESLLHNHGHLNPQYPCKNTTNSCAQL